MVGHGRGVLLAAHPKASGSKGVRVHDLWRTAASWLAFNGSNLPVIQSMLKQKPVASTQIHARLSVAPVRRALDDQAERMLGRWQSLCRMRLSIQW